MDTPNTAFTERDHSGQHQITRANTETADHSHIKGWGADLDHKNRPAYPMERTPPRLEGAHEHGLVDQPLKVKVFHSTERPGVTPIFGTSTPPSGLSGMIREAAYKLSENDIRHWLILMFADRVNVVEGIGADLMQGRIPNIFAEMGLNAEWKHNRAGLIRKVAIASTLAGVTYMLLRRKQPRSYRR
ncbi:MAG: hypothetical protein JWR22_4254 [Herminiimonas sp.]|nr:hypothetical protein [Herminiimonas sp.]